MEPQFSYGGSLISDLPSTIPLNITEQPMEPSHMPDLRSDPLANSMAADPIASLKALLHRQTQKASGLEEPPKLSAMSANPALAYAPISSCPSSATSGQISFASASAIPPFSAPEYGFDSFSSVSESPSPTSAPRFATQTFPQHLPTQPLPPSPRHLNKWGSLGETMSRQSSQGLASRKRTLAEALGSVAQQQSWHTRQFQPQFEPPPPPRPSPPLLRWQGAREAPRRQTPPRQPPPPRATAPRTLSPPASTTDKPKVVVWRTLQQLSSSPVPADPSPVAMSALAEYIDALDRTTDCGVGSPSHAPSWSSVC